MTSADRRQKLLLFLSVDMVGSTQFKARHPITATGDVPGWGETFVEFFDRFASDFRRAVDSGAKDPGTIPQEVRVWRMYGDEIVFRCLLSEEDEVRRIVAAFQQALASNHERYVTLGMGLRGCAWTAGFPIRNKEIRVDLLSPTGAVASIISPQDPPDLDTGYLAPSPTAYTFEYIGLEIDAGFRLARQAAPGMLVASVDVADFLSRRNEFNDFGYHNVGWVKLSGCYGDFPYPVFWLSRGQRRRRNVWDGHDAPMLASYYDDNPLSGSDVQNLIYRYRQNLGDRLPPPYIRAADMHTEHNQFWHEGKIDPRFLIRER